MNAIRGRQGKAELIRQLLTVGGNLTCSTVTIAEIYAGMRPHEKERTEELFADLGAHDVTPAIARYAGLLKNEWAAKRAGARSHRYDYCRHGYNAQVRSGDRQTGRFPNAGT